jgi:TolB-like protein/DNA-binding winged helix-turn-helix (wHTH) protein/Tfp pilus assembly protein PilF
MNQANPSRRVVSFGIFQCDFSAGELRKNGAKVRISDQPFRLLAALLERPGEMVTRQELGERLWPEGTFVGFEDSLNTAVNKLRTALDDESENPRFIETIPRRGYRFIAPVEILPAHGTEAAVGAAENVPGDWRGPRPNHPKDSTVASRDQWPRYVAIISVAVVVAGLAASYVWRRRHESSKATEASIRSIAVLPFDNFSGDSSQDYFADGMTDELITDLAQLSSLRVTSRSSVMGYKGTRKSIAQIGQELHVDAVIEGSVVRSQENVRVDAQLIETSDDRHLWAQSFTQNERDIVTLQDDVAESIAERVEVALKPSVLARLGNAQPVNAEAYEAYLHGVYYLAHHSNSDLIKSLNYFKQATATDPTLAVAYAGTAEAYCYLGDYMVQPDRMVWPQAEAAAQHAIDLNDSISKAHAALAFALWRYEWNWKAADAQFQQALTLNPSDADTHHLYGIFLASEGDFPSATQQLETAGELDPLSLIIRTNAGWLSYYQRDYSGAIAAYQQVLQTDPNFYPARAKLWVAYAVQGNQQEASAELDQMFVGDHREDLVKMISKQTQSVSAAGRFRARLLGYANSGYFTKYEKARCLALAGEKQAALESLKQAEAERNSWLVYAGIDPAFDSLRSSPQFQALLADIHIPGQPAGK